MLANAGQLTPQCISKSMVVIQGYLKWQEMVTFSDSLLYYTGECQISLR